MLFGEVDEWFRKEDGGWEIEVVKKSNCFALAS